MKLPWRWPMLRRSRFTENVHAIVSEPVASGNETGDADGAQTATTSATATASSTSFATATVSEDAPVPVSPKNSPTADAARPSSTRFIHGVTRAFPHSLPKPALRWVGDGGRVALREFDFARDADAVCSWQQETYSLNFPDFRYTDSFSSAFRHDLRRGALDPHHGIFVLDDGQLLGFLWLVICENTWTGDRYGYVNNVYLLPSQRGHGLAREMMTHAERWFRSRGIKRARLTVTASNGVACKLYESCGYETTRWEMEKEL